MSSSGYVFYNKVGIPFSRTEKELIKENIFRILNTRIGERPNNLDFGSRVKELLFMPQVYITDVMAEIKNSIERWEPRVVVKSCTLATKDSSIQDDVVYIDLVLEIKATEEIIETEVQV